MRQKPNLDRPGLISGLLVLAVFATYLPVIFLGFVNYDDPPYVTENPWVPKGLTAAGIKWAFTHAHSANWHPLTWLSHMLDVQFYGLHPVGHHITNVLFHAANTVILFLWLRSLTGACWRSAFVATLFALHPLHVESVAWISERKDVLSGFFGLLSLWTYTRYARESKVRFYVLSLILLALGLMSKPMLVTWPCIFLLLDYWPLRRNTTPSKAKAKTEETKNWSRLFVEKAPFFLLSAITCAITVKTQSAEHAVASLQNLSLGERLAGIPVAYVRYLGKIFWPANLAVLYPLSTPSLSTTAAASAFLIGITLLAFQQRKKRPHLLVGWLWFLGALVPVIGLVQAGQQSIADRYTYLPSIGLFIALTWLLAELAERSRTQTRIISSVTAAVLIACMLVTGSQLLYWQNSEALFLHTLAVTDKNSIAWINLGAAIAKYREIRQAEFCYRTAVQINPSSSDAWFNWGCALADLMRNDEAIAAYQSAIRLDPQSVKLRNNLATAFAIAGRMPEAETQLRAAVDLDPQSAELRSNLAGLLAQESKWNEAVAEFRKAVALDPSMTDARLGLAGALAKVGNYAEAVDGLSALTASEPGNNAVRLQLAGIYVMESKNDLALKEYTEALQTDPKDVVAHCRLATLLSSTGNTAGAIQHYRTAIAIRPATTEALNNLAWTLATNPNAAFRNGAEAVSLAERACRLTDYREAVMMGTLAAAYAEAGRFSDAATTAEKAQDLARKSNDTELAAKNGKLIELYRTEKPYRDGE